MKLSWKYLIRKYVVLILNKNPKFTSYSNNNYHIEVESPAIGEGKSGVQPPKDLDEVIRDVSTPTLGVYEFLP